MDDVVNRIGLSRQVVGDTCPRANAKHLEQGTLTNIQVNDDRLTGSQGETRGQVGGDESLTRRHHERSEHDDVRPVFAVFHVFQARPDQAERLRQRVAPVLLHHDGMVGSATLERDIAQERHIRRLLHVDAVVDRGVHQVLQHEENDGYGKANQDADERRTLLVRRNRFAVGIGIVDHLTRGLQLGAGHQQLLALGEELEIQFLLDALHTFHRVQLQLCDRNALDLRVGDVALAVGGFDAILQTIQVGLKKRDDARMKVGLLAQQLLCHGVVDGTVGLVFLNLHKVLVILVDDRRCLCRDIHHANRNHLVDVVFREIEQIAHHVGLLVELLGFFRQGGTGGHIGLSEALRVDDVVALLEVDRDLFVFLDVRHQEVDAVVDELLRIVEHALLVFDGFPVVDIHQGIQHVGGARRRSVGHRKTQDGVLVVVALDTDACTVGRGHRRNRTMHDHNGGVGEVGITPSGFHDDLAHRRNHRVVEPHFHRRYVAAKVVEHHMFFVDGLHRERGIGLLVQFGEHDLYRRLLVKVPVAPRHLGLI